MYNIGILKWTA